MSFITPIFGTCFRVVSMKGTPMIPIFEDEVTLQKFMLKTNGLYSDIYTVSDVEELVLAAHRKELEVAIIKEVTKEYTKVVKLSLPKQVQWWQRICQCWICNFVATVVMPIEGDEPETAMTCPACGNQTMYPGENDEYNESGD